MTGQELLDNVYTAYKGKVAARTPVWGSAKADIVVSIANRKIQEWATDPNNKWNSLFEDRSVGTVDALVTPTLTYNLDADFFQPSDFARIVKTDDSEVEYPIVKAQQRNVPAQALYIHGHNPKQITFAQTIDTGLDGGTLYVPGYFTPTAISAAADVVPVDDPYWLVYSVAAELARNDAAKDSEYPNLIGMANDLYAKMVAANNNVGFLQPNSVVYNMPSLGDQTEDWA